MPSTIELLDRLVAFDTTSRNSNLPLVDYVRSVLAGAGIACETVSDPTGVKQGLVATVPDRDGRLAGGVALSGHSDVVPVDGQPWTRPPFRLTREDGRLYGRGTTDMKGFVAAALKTLVDAAGESLSRPLHLVLSHDEEVGCKGIRPLLDFMAAENRLPEVAFIGEPTGMRPVVEHKGKIALTCRVSGEAGHSSYAAGKVNAVIEAARLIVHIADTAERIPDREAPDPAYAAPNSSLHVGPIRGGEALNMIPEACAFDFEVRFRPGFDGTGLMEEIKRFAEARIVPAMRARNPATGMAWSVLIDYPAFEAREMPDERRAIQTARELAHRHVGVIAWARDANPTLGEFGVSEELFRAGEIPDLD